MTGFFIPVVSDVFVNKRPVVPGASATAQTPRVTIEQSSPRQEGNPVRVQSNFNFFIAGPTGEGEEAQKLREKARRIVYDMAAHECDLLLEVLAKECRLESVNNNINASRQPQQQEGFNVNGSMSFQILLK